MAYANVVLRIRGLLVRRKELLVTVNLNESLLIIIIQLNCHSVACKHTCTKSQVDKLFCLCKYLIFSALNLTADCEAVVKQLGYDPMDIGDDVKQLSNEFNQFQVLFKVVDSILVIVISYFMKQSNP